MKVLQKYDTNIWQQSKDIKHLNPGKKTATNDKKLKQNLCS